MNMSTSKENTGFSSAILQDPNAASTVPDPNVDAGTAPLVPSAIVQPQQSTPPQAQPAQPAASVPEEKTQMVRLSGERPEDALPEGLTNIGRVGVMIPDSASQQAGFMLTKDQAAALVGQFRQYKFATEKGTDTPSVSI
jgi:hypothetical protein